MRRRLGAIVVALSGLVLAPPAAWGAGVAAPGYRATTYVTGFPEDHANRRGPIGIAFDQSDRLYVSDPVDGNIYRFGSRGGSASPSTRLTRTPIPGMLTGLAVSRSGALYAGRHSAGDVVQVDPATGRVLRMVASVPCATGLAVDPVSGDLFVSENQCGTTIWRVSGLGSRSPTAAPYSYAPGVDGLAFDQGGTLYAESDGSILQIDGTASATPGVATAVAQVPRADGLAFGAHASGQPPFLVANRNDGIVTRVDFHGIATSQSNIFSGGSRGDFAAVDSAGCLYITQSDSIVRISSADNTCGFEPSTPGVVAKRRGAAHVCRLMRSLTVRLRHPHGARLRIATIYLNGKRVRTLRGRALRRPIVLHHLPRRSFTLKLVEVTRRGHRLQVRRFYRQCHRR